MTGPYDDILHLPHHRSSRRSHMSMTDRAAQFSPFAALTGFEAAIEETGRLTDRRPELEDYGNALLDWKLAQLMPLLSQQPEVRITYFLPDSCKSGGTCEDIQGHLKKIDLYAQRMILTNGQSIPMGDIVNIESSLIPD